MDYVDAFGATLVFAAGFRSVGFFVGVLDWFFGFGFGV